MQLSKILCAAPLRGLHVATLKGFVHNSPKGLQGLHTCPLRG